MHNKLTVLALTLGPNGRAMLGAGDDMPGIILCSSYSQLVQGPQAVPGSAQSYWEKETTIHYIVEHTSFAESSSRESSLQSLCKFPLASTADLL